MKREEAIRRMECCRNFLANNYSDIGEPNITAFNMAIKALEQEPCEDVVSRVQALSAIRNLYPGRPFVKLNLKKWQEENKKYFECENIIKALPSVTPTTCIAKVTFDKDELQKIVDEKVKDLTITQEWIPVSERLPEKNVEILATTEWGAVTIAEMYSANDWFIHEGTTNAETDEITAWMSLPEPYKAEMESNNERQ